MASHPSIFVPCKLCLNFSEVFLILLAVINVVLLGLMLAFEFKQKGFTWNGYKTVTLITLELFQVEMIFNFAVVNPNSSFRVLLQTVEIATRGVVFFLVAMYFLKRSSRILLHKQKWTTATNWMLVVVILIFVVIEIVCGVTVYTKDRNDYNVCSGLTDLFLQLDQSLVLVFFIVLAYFISIRIKEQRQLSAKLQLDNREKN